MKNRSNFTRNSTISAILKKSGFIFFLLFYAQYLFGQPTINFFSPTSGPIGATVTINGTNFSNTPANNIVYFGAVRANVSAASATSLVVIVPVGITYQPITITTNNLTCFSNQPFNVTFPGGNGNSAFTPGSFDSQNSFLTEQRPYWLSSGDLDGDGKTDLVIANSNSNSISIYKNTGLTGLVSFAPKNDYPTATIPVGLSIADMDGDGKLDIAVLNYTANTVSVFTNTSITGTVSFAPKADFITGSGPYGMSIGDLNGDGKPDIAITNYGGNSVSILKNNGTAGAISFASKVDFTTGNGPNNVFISDLDGDGKPDLTIPDYNTNTISILKNNGISGAISFNTKIDFITGSTPSQAVVGDFDGDGKPDIAVANGNPSSVSILRNLSTSGTIALASKIDYIIGSPSNSLAIADINGDGRPDIVTANSQASSISALRNISTTGTVSFDTKVDYPVGSGPYSVVSGDIDSDGKPDIATVNYRANTISVLKNRTTAPYIFSFTPNSVGSGSTITITGYNFTGATSVNFGGTPANSFNVVSATTITAVLGTGSTGNVSVTTANGTAKGPLFTYSNIPTVTSLDPVNGGTGTIVTIKGTNLTGATAVSFGGNPASSFTIDSVNSITAVVGQVPLGSISVSVTTTFGTATFGGFFTGPTITSFSPLSGSVGTLVTITGTHFSSVAANNIVNFGAVRATISTASATSLLVTVPTGATYKPIEVTTNNLIAYSNKPFIVTFPNANTPLTSNSFAEKVDLIAGNFPVNLSLSDFDRDGKSDITVINAAGNNLSVFRNTSSAGFISFEAKSDYLTGSFPLDLSAGDLNGDGMPELVVTNPQSNTVSVFTNTSTPGAISFAPKVDYITADGPSAVALGDVNGDGKTDIAVVNNGSGSISVFINNSIAATLSFAPQITVYASSPGDLAIGDLDADGRPDLALTNYTGLIEILQNTTTGGVVSFGNSKSFEAGFSPTSISIGDVDGDGKPDIAETNSGNNGVSLLKNISSGGIISFDTRVYYNTGGPNSTVFMSDLSGDGKPDLVITHSSTINTFQLFRNVSTPGNILFDTKVDYVTGAQPVNSNIGDLDGDGKADLAIVNNNGGNVSIFRNKIAEGELCPGNNTFLVTGILGNIYQWQVNTGIGFSNLTNNSSYQGTTSRILYLNNIPSAWDKYEYRCVVDGVNDSTVKLRFYNTWTGFANTSWENAANWSCGIVPDANTNVVITSGIVLLHSNTTVESLTLSEGVIFTITSGNSLTVTH